MGYDIGDIIYIPHFGVARILKAEVYSPSYMTRSHWHYTLEMLTDPKGFEVYKSVRLRKRSLIDGLTVLKEEPIPKKRWIAYKKDKMR